MIKRFEQMEYEDLEEKDNESNRNNYKDLFINALETLLFFISW